jgi:uncharacterized membrane protein YfcA
LTFEQGALLAAIGFVASFLSGLLGIGGGLVVVPLLIYLPRALGLPEFDAKAASAIGIALVATATLSGTIANIRRRLIERRLAGAIVGFLIVGSLAGGSFSAYLRPAALVWLFAALATAGALLMLLPLRLEDTTNPPTLYRRALAIAVGLSIGFIIGLGGAGAFLLVPSLVFLLRQPTRSAMATSLAAGFPTALAGLAGKTLTGQVPLWPTLVVCALAVPGAQIGTFVSARLPARVLRLGYATVLLTVAGGLWVDILRGLG